MNKAKGLAKEKQDGANPESSSQTNQHPQLRKRRQRRKRRNNQHSPLAPQGNRGSAEASQNDVLGTLSRHEDSPQSRSPLNPPQASQTDTRELHLPQSKALPNCPQTPQNDTQELQSRKNNHGPPQPNFLSIEDDFERRSKYWEIAWNTLSVEYKSVLTTVSIDKVNLEQQLKHLRGHTNMLPSFDGLSTSKPVMIGAKVNRILSNVQRFSKLVGHGSAFRHYFDPAGFVWTGVTFALNLAVKDIKTFEVISNSMEGMTTLLCSCEIHDKTFFQQKNEFAMRVLNSIPPIYAVSLQLTAMALLYTQNSTAGRLCGVSKMFEQEFDSISKAVTEGKSNLEKFALEAQYATSGNTLRHLEREQRQQILDWLYLVKPKDNHNHARRGRAVGSGEWLFQKTEFV